MAKIWRDSIFSGDKRYNVSICQMGTLYRAEVCISYNNGDSYNELTQGDWGDLESATRSYKRYKRKYCAE